MRKELGTDAAFLGKGLSFPPSFDKQKRKIEMVSGERDIEQSLEIILKTRPLERMLAPDFGCNLDRLLFEPANLSLFTLMEDIITRSLYTYEPRIEVNDIQLKKDRVNEGVIQIEIEYTIRSTNTRFNFVYPFYLEEGTDINR